MTIQQTRQHLLSQAYNGRIDPAAWQAFINSCLLSGMEYNATWATRKFNQFRPQESLCTSSSPSPSSLPSLPSLPASAVAK